MTRNISFPSKVKLEEGELVINSIAGFIADESVVKEALMSSSLDRGIWFITNRRLIYEGKKTGKKSVAMSLLFDVLGAYAGMEEEIIVVRHNQIKNLEIVPYAKINKVLKIEYQENNEIKKIYVGLCLMERHKLENLKNDLEKASRAIAFCGNCGSPLTENEKFCPKCGAKRE